ncbi:MAG: GAF domain-containing protein [Candidatus Zixiibacteriota bacterium]|nr:MAG: GAF domain-containing protein [candidate division Zixibacteria bacterium]
MSKHDRNNLFERLLRQIHAIIGGNRSRNEKLESVCRLLRETVSYYDWVGFYLVDPERDRELILGPFAGEPTEHTRIRFGVGICGQAAATGKTHLVDDVSKESNYLACNINVKSEIVVPMVKEGVMIGQIDIDSHTIGAFSSDDEAFLKQVCQLVTEIM